MKFKDSFNRNQLLALGTVALLSPALRLLPSRPAELAGRAAWLTPAVAAPLLLAYAYLLSRLMACRKGREGLAELSVRALGSGVGKGALLLFAGWFTLYAGFILRSGADRLITTIYPQSGPAVFTVVMGLISLLAALGSARSLVRVAKMVLPILIGALLLILLSGIISADWLNLLPITYHDALPTLLGSLSVVDVISVMLYTMCFLCCMTAAQEGDFKAHARWLGWICLLLAGLSVAVVGDFGPELTARLTRPFFSLVRNIVLFNSLERVEALVVMLWVFPDFLLVAMLLYSAQLCLRRLLGHDPEYRGESIKDFSRGRWLIWLCGALAIAAGLLIGPNTESLSFWSGVLIPIINIAVAFVAVPVIFIVGKLRKTI